MNKQQAQRPSGGKGSKKRNLQEFNQRDSPHKDFIERISQERHSAQESDLKESALDRQEAHFLKNWYRKKFLPTEESTRSFWMDNFKALSG